MPTTLPDSRSTSGPAGTNRVRLQSSRDPKPLQAGAAEPALWDAVTDPTVNPWRWGILTGQSLRVTVLTRLVVQATGKFAEGDDEWP